MNARRFFTVFLPTLALCALCAVSCERYKQKHDARERRMEYFRHLADSARTARDSYNDSLRSASDSATRLAQPKR